MTLIDWFILILTIGSLGLGFSRGMVREIFAIVGWVLAIFLALKYGDALARVIPITQVSDFVKSTISTILIGVVTLFVVGLVVKIIRHVIELASLSFEDRLLGGVFGLVRAAVIACTLIFLLGLSTTVRTSDIWKHSVTVGPTEEIITFALPYLPTWIQDLRGNDYEVDVLNRKFKQNLPSILEKQ